MRFFHRRKKTEDLTGYDKSVDKSDKIEDDWEDVPAWIELNDKEEVRTVSLISSAIAMANQPDGSFTIRKVWQRNPEAELVAVLAAAVSTVTEENQLTIRTIRKKISESQESLDSTSEQAVVM